MTLAIERTRLLKTPLQLPPFQASRQFPVRDDLQPSGNEKCLRRIHWFQDFRIKFCQNKQVYSFLVTMRRF